MISGCNPTTQTGIYNFSKFSDAWLNLASHSLNLTFHDNILKRPKKYTGNKFREFIRSNTENEF